MITCTHIKGSLKRDFQLQVFSWISVRPWVFHSGRFKFCWKFVEIFANKCLSPVSTTLAISCSPESTTPAINIAVFVWSSCNISWQFQWHHRRQCLTSAAGDITDLSRFAERTDLCRQYSLSPVKKFSPVLLTPENIFPLKIKFSSCIYW